MQMNVSVASGANISSAVRIGSTMKPVAIAVPSGISTTSATGGVVVWGLVTGTTFAPIKTSGGTLLGVTCVSNAAQVRTFTGDLARACSGFEKLKFQITRTAKTVGVAQANPRTLSLVMSIE